MRAVVYRGTDRIRVEDVPDPRIQEPRDAIVRVSATTICGTDIHLIGGTIRGMKPGTIVGHECVGVVEAVGSDLEDLRKGDRVVVLSTIACGRCRYCNQGWFAHCEKTPVGPHTCWFGSPPEGGAIDGMQAELVRVPFADVGCIPIPDELDDVAALAASDIMPTAFFGLDRLGLAPGQAIVILGAGPVGQMAIAGAHRAGCSKIVAVDREPARLELAQRFPEVDAVDFSSWFGPVAQIRKILEEDHGADCVMDCVGLDAASEWGFHSPGRALEWASEVVRPEGKLSIVGLYGEVQKRFPLGVFLYKNCSIVGGTCNHRAFVDDCLDYLRQHPEEGRSVFTHRASLEETPDAYGSFVSKSDGMIKPLLVPATSPLRKRVATEATA